MVTSALILRNAAPDDAAALAALAGELSYATTADEMSARLGDVLSDPNEAVFVAVAGGVVVAWIHVAEVPSIETQAFAEIRGLVVTASQRSRGIGAQLVHAAEEWAGSRGLARVRVRSNLLRQRTHAFYERLGYTVTKSQKVFDRVL